WLRYFSGPFMCSSREPWSKNASSHPNPLQPLQLNKRILAAALCGIFVCSPVSARVFNSTLRLKVYARGNGEVPDRLLGFTPPRPGHPVRVPADGLWYVRPLGAFDPAKLKRLAKLVKIERIPG